MRRGKFGKGGKNGERNMGKVGKCENGGKIVKGEIFGREKVFRGENLGNEKKSGRKTWEGRKKC